MCKGFLGTQEISPTPVEVPVGRRVTKSWPTFDVLASAGAKRSTTTGTAERATRKRSGMGGEKSELPIVPMKPENTPQWIRRREGGVEQQEHRRER